MADSPPQSTHARESGQQPPTHSPPTSPTSFANAVRNSRPTSPSPAGPTIIIHSQLWKTSTSADGIFFDLSTVPMTVTSGHVFHAIKSQAPAIFGGQYNEDKKDKSKRYFEAYLDDEMETNVMTTGITLETPTGNYQVIPCKALDDDSDIVRVFLSKLPFEPERRLIPKLHVSFARYGDILDLRLNHHKSGLFIGTGHVLLRLHKHDTSDPLLPAPALTHKLHYNGTDVSFHATWANMPMWCRYCHEQGHTKYKCAKSIASMHCYNCDIQGHRAANCPQTTPKKARKTPLIHQNPPPTSPLQAPQPTQILTQSNRFSALATDWADAVDNSELPNDDVPPITIPTGDDPRNPVTAFTHDNDEMELDNDKTPISTNAQLTSDSVTTPHLTPTAGLRHSRSPSPTEVLKTGSHHQQSSYLRHLRSLQPTIYTFQETHISPSTQLNTERLLHPISSLWTRHCGIISYSPDYNITLIDTHSHDRSILCQVSHPNDFYEPFYLLTLYAPADIETERRSFFDGILAWLTNLSSSGTIDLHRLVITGDFNYSLQRSHLSRTTSSAWLGFLDQHFTNAMLVNDCHLVPTYHGPQQRISTIDYIYAGTALSSSARDSQVYTLRPDWSDHNILTTTFMLGHTKTGPGLWRANPAFVQSTSYQEQLTQLIHKYTNDPHHTSLPPAEQWDTLKDAIKQMTRRFGTKHVDWRTATLKFYQRKRHRLLLSQSPPALRQRLLPPIDQVIHTLQQELSDISALRSGITWREKGETSAGFLKRLHQQRQQQQYIHSLSPHADGSSASTNIDTQLLISHQFYQSLYSASPVSDGDIDRYLADTCFKQRLSPADQHLLTAPITIDELQEQASRMVQASSPGDDGFGYPHISLWFSNTSLAKLAVLIYNQALTNGITPASWKSIRLRLLPKKGNLATLKNWRPISLINCDGKIFTRIITRRLAPLLSKIINPLQTGFLPRRFIAENGLALQLIMEQARHFSQDGIGLLLDQEKAYDRIHPRYLQKTMAAMGFPSTLIHSIMTLFFNNRIFVNVNGHFTSAIDQQRGLRQGDPLSPLLFNVAIEPFLLAIQHDHHLQGFTFGHPSHPARSTPSPLKCLAYADDVCVFLHNSEDLDRLQHHMHQYSTLSNAKFNHHKTEAFSLNGRCDDRWSRLLLHHSITTYHHRDSPAPFRYLGFSIGYTKDHQQQVLSTLLANVRKQVGIYSTRNLSIKGKVTVLHSLILSKIWYCLRILVAPQSFFKTLAGICRAFVNSKKPLISYTQMCQPHCQGGLGLMDPQKQQLGMQFRWLNILLQPQQYPSFLGPILLHHLHIAQDPMDSPFLPLLWPTLRRGTLLDSRHIASLWFAAFDSIPLPVNISKASLATCLTIPLIHLCQGVPQDYWLTSASHRRQPASLCLRYDPDNKHLCVKRGYELTSFPTLTRRFLQDIYHQRIAWVPAITTFLTASSIDYGVVDYSPIIKAWVEDPFWQTFQVRAYRFLCSSMSTTTVKFSKSSIQLFWSAPMQPQARTVWYKILINKAPLQAFLAMIHPPQSTMCMLCGQMEDVRHFIYHCSQKKTVWDQVLSLYFPWISDMSPFVLSLQSLPLVPLTPHLYTICGYIIYGIWQAHWQWIMHQIPFDPIATADHIIIQLHSHLSPSLD